MTHFSDLGLPQSLLTALDAEGYHTPTPIQAQAIPPLLKGRDLLGVAQTGTGKTGAFALPILAAMAQTGRAEPNACRTLVLAPTRELAIQIAQSFRTYGAELRLRVTTLYGGVGYGNQTKALDRGVHILVATPGRLLDHIERGTVRLDRTQIFVLDEADQMLDMGFIRPIRTIAGKLPKQRQTLCFSATMPKAMETLASELLHQPERVSVAPQATTAERVSQRVMFIEAERKPELLMHLLDSEAMGRTLIFTRTKHGADRVAKRLNKAKIPSAAIHGNKSQAQRARALDAFKAGSTPILVATDVAARGIDIDEVTHVINYELPNVAESYVHRIGRTARAGAEGEAIAFCADDERKLLRDIEKITRQTLPSEDRREGKSGSGRTDEEFREPRHARKRKPHRNRRRNGSGHRKAAAASA